MSRPNPFWSDELQRRYLETAGNEEQERPADLARYEQQNEQGEHQADPELVIFTMALNHGPDNTHTCGRPMNMFAGILGRVTLNQIASAQFPTAHTCGSLMKVEL